MAGGTRADLDAMAAIAKRLNDASSALDETGRTSPGIPNAGEASGIMGVALGHLTESAGNLVLGMRGAGEEVAKARQDYVSSDEAAANSLRGY